MIDFTIKNYRCFADSEPARFTVRPGFTSFVGANNSGKSSLLRFFYEFRHLFAILASRNLLVYGFRGQTQSFQPAQSIKDTSDLFNDTNERSISIEMQFDTMARGICEKCKIVVEIPRVSTNFTLKFFLGNKNLGQNLVENGSHGLLFQLPNLVVDFAPFLKFCGDLQNSLYIGPFRNAINVGSQEEYFDIQAGESFVKTWRNFKTGPNRKQNEAIYRITEEIGRIFDIARLEINPSPDDRTLQIFVNGKSYKLNEVGSGLTQFIIVLASAAIRNPEYMLIDEPELNLHASLQTDFLTTLGSYAGRGVLFGTHNVGLARAGSDIVYAVRRIEQGKSDVRPLEALPRLSDFVGELGFSGYKELGFDQVLLVEGATEVRTMQQFLRPLKKEHKVVLIPLGGSALINGDRGLELQELKRISENVAALIDSERSSEAATLEPARQAFSEVCAANHINCCVLKRRATENYLTDAAVKRVKGNSHRSLAPYERLGDVSPSWSKSENWRIAREMEFNDISGTDLGEFLEKL
ncbi:MAG TPA: AAA family ATPase [Candidatus Angelobacter sp.]|nr:AAA family ATPase [Candidatus Angelobacter sp.]